MSRIDFTPAHTTQIPTRASVPRSADSSNVLARAAVHAAEPAGGEHADARRARPGARSRRRSSRRTPRAREHRREVAHAALGDAVGVGERVQRVVVEPDPHLAAEDRDRRRHRAVCAHDVLDLARHAQVVRPRQPVGDDRALERNDRPALVERRPDFFVDHASPRNDRRRSRPAPACAGAGSDRPTRVAGSPGSSSARIL